MNYKMWANDYSREAENITKAIDKEKVNLKKSKRMEETQSINRRIQILRSMLYECKLTAQLLMERGGTVA